MSKAITSILVTCDSVTHERSGRFAPRPKGDKGYDYRHPRHVTKTHEIVDFTEDFDPPVDHDSKQGFGIDVYDPAAWGKLEVGKKYRIEIHPVE